MSENQTLNHPGVVGLVRRIIDYWALLGGFILIAVVLMNVLSVIGGVLWRPFPGDFELTQIGAANAAFSFLPYCQIHYKNVTADIFTTKAEPRTILMFRFLASLVALLFACLLCWRMFAGMLNQYQYDYTTAIVQFPIWLAFVPILWSLVLLSVAALISLCDEARAIMKAR